MCSAISINDKIEIILESIRWNSFCQRRAIRTWWYIFSGLHYKLFAVLVHKLNSIHICCTQYVWPDHVGAENELIYYKWTRAHVFNVHFYPSRHILSGLKHSAALNWCTNAKPFACCMWDALPRIKFSIFHMKSGTMSYAARYHMLHCVRALTHSLTEEQKCN